MRKWALWTGAAWALAGIIGAVWSSSPAVAARATSRLGRQVRIGAAPVLPAGATMRGLPPAAEALHLTVVLRPRDPARLAAYATAVADPGSALFRHYLSVRAFVRRFAPTMAQVDAVLASLRAHGLSPGRVTANRLSVPIDTSIGTAEHAFSLSFARLKISGRASAVTATARPAVDRSVAGIVQAVIGINGLARPQPLRAARSARAMAEPHVATGGPQPCSDASSAAAGQSAYTADQIASAYGFSGLYRAGDEGQGTTVALYELEPDDPADIAAYQRCYGTHAQVGYVPVDGGAGSGPGSGEAALDIEQLIGLAPRARLIVYQGPNASTDGPGSGPYDTDAAIVSEDRASVVSTSWGECEAAEGASDARAEGVLFEEAAVQGQTVLSASGDSGSEDCSGATVPSLQLAVDDPSSQPYVTGVGGTTLNALGPPPAETTWNNGGNAGGLLGIAPGAGGGGISSLWSMPAYQATAPASLHVVGAESSSAPCQSGSGDCREVPDVAADADPNSGYTIFYNGSGGSPTAPSGWQGTGGTSGAAPLWAALIALANANSACGGLRVGFANPALYRLAAAGETTYFNDVSTGNNDFTGTGGGRYPAGAGFDMATGLGSPRAAALATGLCRETLRLAAPAAHQSFVGTRTSLRLRVSDGPTAQLRLSVRGLPAGLALRAGPNRIVGKPRRVGVYRVILSASDRGGAVRAVSFTWTIAGRPHLRGARLSGLSHGRPILTVAAVAGRDEAPLRTLALSLPAGLRVAGRSTASVRLRTPAPVVKLALRRGLGVSAALIAAARRGSVPILSATVLDSSGARSVLRVRLRTAGR